jgi:hypothetical protein
VRTVLVVVGLAFAQDSDQVRLTPDEGRVEDSLRQLTIQRSMIAFAPGARTGLTLVRVPAAANTASRVAVNFVSRSRRRNFTVWDWSPRSISRFRACYGIQALFG